jgi:hypothetical protein
MGYLLDKNATGKCSHGASASPVVGNPRVKIGGVEVLTIATQFTISGCSNMAGNTPFPCLLGVFASGATRVKAGGMAVLLESSTPTNVPTGASTTITNTQARVKGI